MSQKPLHLARMAAILPFFALQASPLTFLLSFPLAQNAHVSSTEAHIAPVKDFWEVEFREMRKERAAKIDAYFWRRSMPLVGQGDRMVRAAEEHNIDWRLLPAIAVRESSGGKQMCGNNPFGWASCRVHFTSVEAGIDTVALHLGGNHPKTEGYYRGGTEDKLMSYNGTVIPTYVDEVVAIMDKIESEEVQ